VFFIEHSGASLHATLKSLKVVGEDHFQMQNERHNGFKVEGHHTNRFNDSEYKRWSEGLNPTRTFKTPSGIQGFLGMNENLQPGCKDNSLSSMGLAKTK
jgi:hypothetical protein